MILQGESYEFGTVFQTVAFFLFVIPRLRPGLLSLRSVLSSRQILLLCWLVACWMLLVGSLLVGYRLLDIACWLVAFWLVAFWQYWQSTKQQNHKTTRQQDNKKNAYRNLHIGWSFHRSRVRLFMQSEVFP